MGKRVGVEVKFGLLDVTRSKIFTIDSQNGTEYVALEAKIINWLSDDDPLMTQILQTKRLLLTEHIEKFNMSFEIDKDHVFSDFAKVSVTFVPKNLFQDMLQAEQSMPVTLSSPPIIPDTDVERDKSEEKSHEYDEWDSMETVLTAEGECLVQKMKSDGDCLFAAITHQLFQYTPYSTEHKLRIKEARRKTVEYLRDNQENTEMRNVLTTYFQEDDIRSDNDQIESFLQNLMDGCEWGGEESIFALGITYNCCITVHQESVDMSERALTYNPEGFSKAVIVYRLPLIDNTKPRNHYDSLISFTNGGNSKTESAHDQADTAETNDFTMIEEYFSPKEWRTLSEVEKIRYKGLKTRYLFMKERKMEIPLPDFMAPKRDEPQKRQISPKKSSKKTSNNERTSSREASQKARAAISSLAESESPVKKNRPHLNSTTTVLDGEDSSDDAENSDKENDMPEENFTNPSSDSSPPSSSKGKKKKRKTNHSESSGKRRKPQPKIRTIGTTLTNALPTFSDVALRELNRSAHKRNVRPINLECKAFIRKVTKDDYPTKFEYDRFARNMVAKYPKLASKTSTEPHIVFKKSLSASLRAERSNTFKRLSKKALTVSDSDEDQPSENKSDSDVDISDETEGIAQEKELKTCANASRIPELLEKTTALRLEKCIAMTPWDIFQTYNHLRLPNMMIYDFALRKDVDAETMHTKFDESMALLSKHYKMKLHTEFNKLQLLMEVHKYFKSKQVQDGAKPVLTVRDVKEVQEQLSSTDIQAPFLVIMTKVCLYTGTTKLVSTSLMMQDRLLSTIENPTTEESILLLIASYFTLNVEYPIAYSLFLRAVEKLLTGSLAPSKYGQTKAKFEKFMSMIGSIEKKSGKKRKRN